MRSESRVAAGQALGAGLDPAFDPKRDEKVTEWLQQLATVIAKR
jgi:hypothetical protein